MCGDAVVCIAASCFCDFPVWCVPALRCCPCLESEMPGGRMGEKGPIYCGCNPIPTMNVEVVGLADTGAPKVKLVAVGGPTEECDVVCPPPKETMTK